MGELYSKTLKSVWLVTWEYASRPQIPDEAKIAAILKGNCSGSTVRSIMVSIFQSSTYSAFELSKALYCPSERQQSLPEIGPPGHIFVGNHPFLFGRQVANFSVQFIEREDMEQLSWKENPTPRNDPKTGKLTIKKGEENKTLLRKRATLIQRGW